MEETESCSEDEDEEDNTTATTTTTASTQTSSTLKSSKMTQTTKLELPVLEFSEEKFKILTGISKNIFNMIIDNWAHGIE